MSEFLEKRLVFVFSPPRLWHVSLLFPLVPEEREFLYKEVQMGCEEDFTEMFW